MAVSCPHCHRTFSLDEYVGGTNYPCPHCFKSFLLPLQSPPEAWLEIEEGEAAGKKILLSSKMMLGRSADCEIQLMDPNVSRQHAEIVCRQGTFYVRDLGSRNGVVVNGTKIGECSLSSGDAIRLGNAAFRFVLTEPSDGSSKIPELELTEIETTHTQPEISHFQGFQAETAGSNASYVRATTCLQTVFEISEALAGVTDTDTILARILDPLLKVVTADRAFVVLKDPLDGEFRTRVARFREGQHAVKQVHMSRSILHRVVTDKVALLVADVNLDARFDTQQSIISQGIRSVLCAPLAIGTSVFGVLVLDTTVPGRTFDQEDLKMLTAIARQASVALENARLVQKVAEEARTRSSLERYLSPALVDQVVHRTLDMQLGGDLRQLTVMFTDIRGFTKLAAQLSPVNVLTLINEHFSLIVEILFRHGATLDKFLGDSVMAFWGAPVACPDAAFRAVACAVEMQQAMAGYNATVDSRMREAIDRYDARANEIRSAQLHMGIGINTGEAVVGNVGSPRRYEYTAIGHTVNVASRLQGLAKGGQILISESTRDACGDRIVVSEPSSVVLAGQIVPTSVFLVGGIRPGPIPSAPDTVDQK